MQTILIVEDEEPIRMVFEIAFGATYNILAAEDYNQGIELYKKHQPDLLITDLSLPCVSGLELIRKIREIDTATPIVAWSGAIAKDKEHEVYQAGATLFLRKPVDLDQLAKAFQGLLDKLESPATC